MLLSGSDDMYFLSDAGHHASHLQSREACVAHVSGVCIMLVRDSIKYLNLVI